MAEQPALASHTHGVLVLDDTGDCKDGHATAHMARQYIGSRGKIDNGIVAVTTLWADERCYWKLHAQPYALIDRHTDTIVCIFTGPCSPDWLPRLRRDAGRLVGSQRQAAWASSPCFEVASCVPFSPTGSAGGSERHRCIPPRRPISRPRGRGAAGAVAGLHCRLPGVVARGNSLSCREFL
jgi:hypothetical protein